MTSFMQSRLVLLLVLISILILQAPAGQFVQQGPKLRGTGAGGNAGQGHSVAISADGNTAILGALTDSGNTGAAWVFTRSGGVWTQQGPKLVGTGAEAGLRLGVATAISADGNTAIVTGWSEITSEGGAWVFVRNAGVWTQQGSMIVPSGAVGLPQFGYTAAMSNDGNTAVVGGAADDNFKGAVWVFTRSGGVWTQQGSKLVGTGSIGSSMQGTSVALSGDGNTLLVGGSTDNGPGFPNVGIGAAWVFTRSGGVWTQQGGKLVGTGYVGSNPRQGLSASLSEDGNTAMIGGYTDGSQDGATWVFVRSAGVWTQQGPKLVGTGAAGSARQGVSVDLAADGNRAVIAGYYDNNVVGAVWIFERNGTTWTQQGTKYVGGGTVGQAWFGRFVSMSADGNTFIAGGYGDDNFHGAAWVFRRDSTGGDWGITDVSDVPADQGGKVLLTWTAIHLDTNTTTLPYYSIWRSLGEVVSGNAARTQSATYRTTIMRGKEYAWEWLANQPAHRFGSYSYAAQTLYDSMAGIPGTHYFLVSAHTDDANVFYDSNVDSGYSVDNLAPYPPGNFAGSHGIGGFSLSWDASVEGDLSHYLLYRSETPGIDPSSVSPLAVLREPFYMDPLATNSTPYYYTVVAVDIHGNTSPKSSELSTIVTGVPDGNGIPTEYALQQNYPNPFNPVTRIEYALPHSGYVSLVVFDITGREVAVLVDGHLEAGFRSVVFDAAEYPTGLYVYRITAGGFSAVRKMVLVK